jgi:hypothetical protein
MNKKRAFGLLLIGFFIVSSFAGIASAAFWDNLREGFEPLRESIVDPIKGFTENTAAFVRFLFFILVFLIVIAITGFIPLFNGDDKRWIKILFSLVVTILAVMFIPTDLILPMLNPYTAMGVAFISIIPFALMVVFTEKILTNVFVRQVVWMFFAITLLGMTVYTGILQYSDPDKYGSWYFSAVYALMSILALSMVYFNATIRRRLWHGRLEGLEERAERDREFRRAGRQQERQEAALNLGVDEDEAPLGGA